MISHNNHSENLLVVIEEGLKEKNLKLKDFDKVIVGDGPGSYTGLRIAMVVAKMISYTLDIPMYTISSLSLIGSGYISLNNDKVNKNILISSKAKKNHSYIKVVESNTGKELVSDSFVTDDEKEKIVSQYDAFVVDFTNYNVKEEVIISLANKVENVHEVIPNYLRQANT